MRMPATRAPRTRQPVPAFVRKLLAQTLSRFHAPRVSRRMREIDDADLAQRVRLSGEW